MSELVPIWGNAATVAAVSGVPPGVLRRLVAEGHVRRRKLGESRQALALYRIGDVLEYLDGCPDQVETSK